MSQDINFSELDGAPVVARRGAGRANKVAIGLLGVATAIVLVWFNMPSSPVQNKPENQNEIFNPPEFRGATFSDAQTGNSGSIETIVIAPPTEPSNAVQADNVEQVVQVGDDLEARRLELERQMAADEARRLQIAEAQRLQDQAELERLRALEEAEKEGAKWKRYRSSQVIVDFGDNQNSPNDPVTLQVAPDGQLVPGSDTDLNKQFLAQTETATRDAAKAKVFRRTDALIAEGTMIRGFLESAVNTDLPGMVRAVIQEDVYSLDGRRVLIPRGSRLTGEYRPGLARGQKRVFVVWNRVIRSDGISIDINSAGADSLGRAGLTGKVDNHWLERYGSAIMLSMLGGVSEVIGNLADSNNAQRSVTSIDPATGATIVTSYGGGSSSDARAVALQRSSSSLQAIAQEAFKDGQNISPTVHVNQGTQITVFVRRDLDFSEQYADPLQEELARLKKGGKPRHAINPTPVYTAPSYYEPPVIGRDYFPPAPAQK